MISSEELEPVLFHKCLEYQSSDLQQTNLQTVNDSSFSSKLFHYSVMIILITMIVFFLFMKLLVSL